MHSFQIYCQHKVRKQTANPAQVRSIWTFVAGVKA